MQIHTLPAITTKKARRRGLGHASGRGKTAGRGTKGQNARSSRSLSFEGGALPLIKRLPFRRGKGANERITHKPIPVNLEKLSHLQKNSVIDIKTLLAHKIVSEKEAAQRGVKILGNGEVTVALKVTLPVSKSAKEKIEKAGGSVVV